MLDGCWQIGDSLAEKGRVALKHALLRWFGTVPDIIGPTHWRRPTT
jgi:hypothetical protein